MPDSNRGIGGSGGGALNILGESTGVKTGGVLSTGAGSDEYTIEDGTGQIVTSEGVVTTVAWSGKSNIIPTNLGTHLISFVAIDSSGDVVEQTVRFSNVQARTLIVLGVVIHVNLTTVDTVNNEQHVAYNTGSQLFDLFEGLGFFNVSGNLFSPNGSNLTMDKSTGVMFAAGSNYPNDADNPHPLTLASLAALSFQYRFSDGSNGVTGTAFDPANLDDGAGGLTALSADKKWGVSRIYSFTSNNVKIQRGVEEFGSKAKAIAGISAEAYITEPSIAANGLLRGWLVHKKNVTDLSDTDKALFIEAGKFGAGTQSGGSLGATDLQGAYDNSLSPEILTDSTRGALSIKRGSSADTDNVLEVLNGAGTTVFQVTGEGKVVAAIGTAGVIGIALGDESTDIETGTATVTFRMPHAFTLTDIRLSAVTAPTGSGITVDVNETGSTILSTKLTLDATEKTSETAATAAVISDADLADDAEITVDIDAIGSTIAGAGLKLWLIGSPA